METRNAVITDASIGFADHGILTAFIRLDYGGEVQVFGGCRFYSPKAGISGKNCAGYFIYRVLETAGVDRWEQLKGKAVRVRADHAHVEAVGNIIKDVWFEPEKEFAGADQDVPA
jgi:hypothetical protein